MTLLFFAEPAAFRTWLEANHASETELWVGFYKKATGRPSLTWPESVDEALCFGWIDGLRKRVDEESYKIRFTPRKASSNWSAVNVGRVEALKAEGRMQPAGLAAYARLKEGSSRVYSYEQRRDAKLDPAYEEEFRAHEEAWKYFRAQAPWYQRTAIFWVMSAKREPTRKRRLGVLMDSSAEGRPIPNLARPKKSSSGS